MKRAYVWALAALVATAACADDKEGGAPKQAQAIEPVQTQAAVADLPPFSERELTPEELERGRNSNEWTSVVQLDTTGAGSAVRNPEKWEMISPQEMNRGATFLPLGGDVAGPSVYRVQILLDRALFSPGMMDGRWGKNTAKAVYFFQQQNDLPTTGRVDSATYERLIEAAGKTEQLVLTHTLTAEDVKGPFVTMPDSIYDIAKLDCTCYENVLEKLSEEYHTTQDLLTRINPGVDLMNAAAGQTINVPARRDRDAPAKGKVAELVVSGKGSYVHAVDAEGRILYHFPSTLGGTYEPSPQGSFRVTNVTKKPWWHYQPAILANVPDDRPDARIPPGPNNAVGMVWMSLSVPHYGIHGTKSPETIGYATSAGCVRLTNWDALFLADRIGRNVPVRFRDIQGRTGDDASGLGSALDERTKGGAAPATAPARDSAAGRPGATGRDSAATKAGGRGAARRDSAATKSGGRGAARGDSARGGS